MRLLVLVGAAGLAACGHNSDPLANRASPAAKKERPKYCFFKDADSKGWTAERGKDGNITVSGKLYRSDGRYMAVLGEPKIKGSTVEYWPSVTTNTTGVSMADGWWTVTATIPNSANIVTVDIKCGSKTFAEFKLPPK